MAVNARGNFTGNEARQAFPLYNYIGQNGPKMAKNGQKMAKNDPNDLKIRHMMYLGGFY